MKSYILRGETKHKIQNILLKEYTWNISVGHVWKCHTSLCLHSIRENLITWVYIMSSVSGKCRQLGAQKEKSMEGYLAVSTTSPSSEKF